MGGLPPEEQPLPDWYKVLELTKEASASAIRTAYKRLAFQYHPDKTLDEKLKPEMTKRFTQIQEAYEVLSDSRRRREYDEDVAHEAKIMEDFRRAQEMRDKAKRGARAQHRNKEEARWRKEEDRIAEMEYMAGKRQEEEMLRAAMQAQEARKAHAADQERKRAFAEKRDDPQRRKDDDRRVKAEQKRQREEEQRHREAERLEKEKLQREEDKKRHDRDHEKRTKDRRSDRKDKENMQQFPIDDILDPEPLHFDRPEKPPRDRGRPSKERLADPNLHIPRDPSKTRDRSRNRREERERDSSRHREHRERETASEFATRDFERDRKHRFYENNPRRMSTEPLHEDYLRAPGSGIYGSPPHSYSTPRSATYSPPSSPKLRHSNPTMSSTHSFQTPNKGRDRTRDRPSDRNRKHSEAGLYSRDSFPSSIPEDVNTSMPGNRDSGYSTSSNGTPLRSSIDPRISSEKLDSTPFTGTHGKKFKVVPMYVPVDDESEDDGTSTIGKSRSKRATKQASREDPRSSYAPRHQPPVDLEDNDPFQYMTKGSKTFSYSPKETNYSAKLSVHQRSNSDHSPPNITVEGVSFSHGGVPSSHKSRHVPPVGGASGAIPSLGRYSTWAP